jgi:hypothetical protein
MLRTVAYLQILPRGALGDILVRWIGHVAKKFRTPDMGRDLLTFIG